MKFHFIGATPDLRLPDEQENTSTECSPLAMSIVKFTCSPDTCFKVRASVLLHRYNLAMINHHQDNICKMQTTILIWNGFPIVICLKKCCSGHLREGYLPGEGRCLPGGGSAQGRCIPACNGVDTPTMDRIFDTRLWKHYHSTTTVADGKNSTEYLKSYSTIMVLTSVKCTQVSVLWCILS